MFCLGLKIYFRTPWSRRLAAVVRTGRNDPDGILDDRAPGPGTSPLSKYRRSVAALYDGGYDALLSLLVLSCK